MDNNILDASVEDINRALDLAYRKMGQAKKIGLQRIHMKLEAELEYPENIRAK